MPDLIRRIIVSSIVLLCISSVANAAELDGSYAGQCDGTIQCAVEIENHVDVSVIVADRLDYAKKRCVISGHLQRSDTGLAGPASGGAKLFVVGTSDGGVYLNGVPRAACGMNLNGYYGAIGD